MNRQEILHKITTHQSQLEALGIKSLELFGSVAKNNTHINSDIDLLAEFSQPISLFQFIRIKLYLQDILGHPVDLGTREALKENLRQPILQELIRVF
ncbi:nucleotidyltransferase family protein [Euhalothece natronophila Z-M001]|uniref:Nucleotidyltransferase family protein n=1 Tax=Euhalothece natronophila Z-M001 TaxID=522448 RepID=A0A5B8NQ77_9CHRO|nr:nucleotidyltransferase family protein [Euhalothece natronophila]QDZ41174.1 nucleotidyltransferase family protein [Euhalothece natronophila Z-M001]